MFGNRKKLRGTEIEDYLLTATEKEASHMERPMEKRWFDIVWRVLVVLMLVLFGRAFYLTVVKGPYYKEVAKGNSVRSIVIKAPRGKIFDRHGASLVNNIPSVDVVIVPADFPAEGVEIESIAERLSRMLSVEKDEIISKISGAKPKSLNPILIKENISQDEMLLVLEKADSFPGVKIEKTAVREYADSSIFAHVLGYEGKIEKKELEENPGYLLTDYIGKQGLEKTYEKYLRGVHGALQVEVDSLGNPKREIGIVNPRPGSDLILSIDGTLQKKLHDTLSAALERTDVETAAAVALNPKNGEVLALLNLPSFDNNLFAKKISQEQYLELINNPQKPLFNRAIGGEYPPGSTVKPFLATAALKEGIVNQSTIIDGMGGVLRIGSFSYRDWKVHGPSDIRTAIAESNDIYFYTIGGGYGNIRGLGIGGMKKYYNLFGFGKKTGIDLTGEASGFIPDENWKMEKFGERWYVGNSYHASIGQGYVTATPLQVAVSTAAIANGGKVYRPHVVSQIRNHEGDTKSIEPEVISEADISSEIMNIAKEGMRKTVTGGTAQYLKNLPIEVAGKTGTSQFGSEGRTHIWFASFAPYQNPEIVLVVLIEGVGNESSVAVPVTKDIYEWYFTEYKKSQFN